MKRRKKQTANAKIKNAKALSYYGIQFKSRLELYMYKKLKAANIKFGYENHTFQLLDKFTYGGDSMELLRKKGEKCFDWQNPNIRGMTYTPDFCNLKNNWIIECKGFANDVFPLKWKLFKKYMNENHPGFTLYMPRNQKHIDIVVEHIKQNDKRRTTIKRPKRSV